MMPTATATLQGRTSATVLLPRRAFVRPRYEAAAQQGDVPARRRIGDLIHQGAIFAINGTPDHARAVQAYASLPSDAEAVHSLAYMHEHGLGTDRNASEALRLYAHAAHLGRNATARGSPKESLPATEGQIASEAAAVALSIKEAARSVAASFSSFFAFGKKKEGGEL
ncbi:hypothetical protein T484DRAFT_3614451 [Baffinella frigidus]|nr:hypothetical protein T484DRAFT_3614451 [Cryptophyta sp. CCMP2293]